MTLEEEREELSPVSKHELFSGKIFLEVDGQSSCGQLFGRQLISTKDTDDQTMPTMKRNKRHKPFHRQPFVGWPLASFERDRREKTTKEKTRRSLMSEYVTAND